MKQTPIFRPVILGLVLLSTGLPGAINFVRGGHAGQGGISDTGLRLDSGAVNAIPMTTYSGLNFWGGGGNPFTNGLVGQMNLTLSEAANGRFASGGVSTNSVTGLTALGFIFTLDRDLMAGEQLSATLDFPLGLTRSGNNAPFTVNQGHSGSIDDVGPGNYSAAFAGRIQLPNFNPTSNTDSSAVITGTLLDGSDPDFSTVFAAGANYAGAGTGTTQSTYNYVEDGAGAPTLSSAGGGSNNVLTFLNDGDTDGFGAGIRTRSEFAWGSQTFTWVAGTAGLPAGTQFRLSIDGSPLTTTFIPEPSRVLLLAFAGGLLLLRRNRAVVTVD